MATSRRVLHAAVACAAVVAFALLFSYLCRSRRPPPRRFVIGNNVVTVEKLRLKGSAPVRGLVEAFDAAPPPVPPLPAALRPQSESAVGGAPSVAGVSPTTPPDPAALTPAGAAGAVGRQALPSGTVDALEPSSDGPGAVANPDVCTLANKQVWTFPDNRACADTQRRVFADASNRACLAASRSAFVASDPGRRCTLEDRSFYDGSAPQKLRTELALLDARRREIAEALKIDLDAGVKVGCSRNDDCNVLNWDVQGRRNVCQVDNTCYCHSGSGALCQHPSNFKDTRSMSPEEKQRFRTQNDLSRFTVRDYYNWLMLFKDDVQALSDDHVSNLKRFLNGDTVTKAMIPRMRESPPPSAAQQLAALWNVGAVRAPGDGVDVLLADGGPFMPYNYNDFQDFAPPRDTLDARLVNLDVEKKVDAVELARQLTPRSDRLLTGKA